MSVPIRLIVRIAMFALKHHSQISGAVSATTAAEPGILAAGEAWAPLIGEWMDKNQDVTSPSDQVEGFLASMGHTEKLTPEEKSSINADMEAAMERQSNIGQQ